jgi:integrase
MRPEKRRPSPQIIKKNTFAAVIRSYLASPKFNGLAHRTQIGYRHYLGLAEQPETLGAYPVDVIRPSLVQAFLDGLADRPAAQRAAQATLKAVERWAIVRDLLPYPITTGTEAPGGVGAHEPWTDEQVRLAETASRPHISRIITLKSNTGQRGSDIIKMRWSDLEEYEGRLGINVIQKKTGLPLWIPFTAELAAAIGTWERRPTFIALKPDGQPWTRAQLSNAWLRERRKPALAAIREAGLVLHGLRATAVVRLRRAGASSLQISDMVGMSEQMVNRYCRKANQRTNALAAVHYLENKTERRTTKPEHLNGDLPLSTG